MAIERWWPRWGVTRAPRRELTQMEREMEDLFGRFFREWGAFPRWPGEARGWTPAVDMIDRKDEVVLRADLPGLEQKDIEVTIDQGVLTLRGERKEEKEVKEEDYYYAERWGGTFTRRLALPPGVDAEKIKATFKNGILEVHLPKTKEAKGKKIEVKVE